MYLAAVGGHENRKIEHRHQVNIRHKAYSSQPSADSITQLTVDRRDVHLNII
jgi:hypothetical protein